MKNVTKVKRGILPVLVCSVLVLTMINGIIKVYADASVNPVPPMLPAWSGIVMVNSEDVFVTADDSVNKTCTITGYTGSEVVTTLYIPEKIKGNKVVAVSDQVFHSCYYLRNLIIYGDVEFNGSSSSMFYVTQKPTIWGKKGTKPETFAASNGLVFQAMDGPQEFSAKTNTRLLDRAAIKWSTVEGAVSYKLYRRKGNGMYTLCAILGDNSESFSSSGLEAGAAYTFKMHPVFRTSDNEEIEGLASKEASVTMKLTELKKLRAKGIKDGIQLNWERDKDVSGYEIFMKSLAKGAKAGYKRIKVIGKNKTTSYHCKKLVKGTKYSFKVRSFKTLNKGKNKGKKVYSSFVTVNGKAK